MFEEYDTSIFLKENPLVSNKGNTALPMPIQDPHKAMRDYIMKQSWTYNAKLDRFKELPYRRLSESNMIIEHEDDHLVFGNK
jgi:hypothetical protein